MIASPLSDRLELLLGQPGISDVHLEVGRPLWARQSGALAEVPGTVVELAELQALLQAHEAETALRWGDVESRLAKKGDLDFSFNLGPARVRANLYRANHQHLCLALRRIPEVPEDWGALGIPETLRPLLNRSKGLVLVTGPTGAGKSSTLAAIIEHLNQSSARHILTLEDPVEYVFTQKRSLIQQRQIGREAPNFAMALRAALREDPDVIMLGELRDFETVETALHAANTGHLVLGTLHTPGAMQAVERIELLFPEHARKGAMQTLSSVLVAVLSQVLVPRAKGGGRLLAYELMINTPSTRQAIQNSKINNLFTAMDGGRRDGHVLLNHNLGARIRAGDISREDGLYCSYDPAALEKELTYAR